jgi:predicted RNase H-like HicB family nuclease
MRIDYQAQVWRENDQCIAHAQPLDVASSGATPEAARAALEEAVQLFLVTATGHGTLETVLEEAGYSLRDGEWRAPDWVSSEPASALVEA